MSSECCAICKLESPEPSHFWKEHRIKESDYYVKYFPRFDLLTNEPISFKSRDGYLLTDFQNKINLKNWLQLQNIETQKEYLKNILIKRREVKNLTYVPTQVELRSWENSVGILTYNKLFKDYYKLCEELGYISRGFSNLTEKTILKPGRTLKNNPILCDSREQIPLSFGSKNIEITGLKVGDYTIKNDNYGIFIERKSVADLCSTFGPKNFDRFRNELIKAKDLGLYVILLVEHDINTVSGFDHSPFYSKHTQMTAVYLFHQIRALLQEIDCWQIAFCKSRTDMADKIKLIFEMEDFWKTSDVQLAIDLKLFNGRI